MTEARALVLNDALCFLLCKYGTAPVKLLRSALLDFYSESVISEAKVCLLDNIEGLQLASKLPHVLSAVMEMAEWLGKLMIYFCYLLT